MNYLIIFTISTSTNHTPVISPRPFQQKTIGNKTTISFEKGLSFPANVEIQLPTSELLVDSLIYIAKALKDQKNEVKISGNLSLQTVKPNTPQCDAWFSAVKESEAADHENRIIRACVFVFFFGVISPAMFCFVLYLMMERERQSELINQKRVSSFFYRVIENNNINELESDDRNAFLNELGPSLLRALRRATQN